MKILLPVCGADDANLIVGFVCNYKWPPQASFKVIHVLGSSTTDSAATAAQKDATELVNNVIVRLKAVLPSASMCSEVLPGEAIYEIVATASKWSADMIVMGYRTRKEIQSLLAGSVSKGVAMQAPCSVAIIRPPVCKNEALTQQALAGTQSRHKYEQADKKSGPTVRLSLDQTASHGMHRRLRSVINCEFI